MLKQLTLALFLLATPLLHAQNCCDVDDDVDLCYLSGADYCGSNAGFCFGYSLDGDFMDNALQVKLSSPDNFGPDGIVDCDLTLKKLETINNVDDINACGCDIIFMPNVFIEPGTNTQDLSQSFIPPTVLQSIYDWSLECENNLVIASQGEANTWGYTTTNSNVNPNTPVAGSSLNSIFDGPFGMLNSFNQGGTFQGVFTGTPATGFETLANDANGNITAALDLASNDILVGDIGIFCSGGAGVVSAGAGVNNNNDILIMNMFALACQLAEEGNKVTVTHELCPGETATLPDGTIISDAGIFVDTLVAFNGCDSIITTAVAYGIAESPIFVQPDTIICQGDTIQIDGSVPIDVPIPYFENTSPVSITPTFFNVVSEIPVGGFGAQTLQPGILTSICFNIEHNWLDDLDIFLIAPNGELLELSTDNGLNQDDYIGTCFTETALQVIGSAGTAAPFTGDFLPEGDWTDIYGTPIDGIWQLVIKDDANGFDGTLFDWNITFEPLLDLTYEWTTPTGLTCDDCPVTEAFPNQTTTYFLTITDSYGCSTLDSTLVAVIPPLPAPEVFCDETQLNSILVNWNAVTGATSYQINVDGMGWIDPNVGDLSHLIDGLSPLDTVEIMVQAVDECGGGITTITCSTPDCDKPEPSIDVLNSTSCFAATDGSVHLSATGGSGSGYVFELNGTENATGIFENLAGGIYEFTVTDDVDCSIKIEVEIPEPDSLTLLPLIESEITCNGAANGSLTVAIEAGIAPFSFAWNSTVSDSILSNVAPGMYEILVTDANDCTNSASISINEPPLLIAQSQATLVDCFGNNTGTASLLPEGGTGDYTYLWDNNADNQTTATATELAAGIYAVTVFDANDCEFSTQITVEEPEELMASLAFSDPNCFAAADGNIEVTTTGGTPTYNFDWSDNTLADAPIANMLTANNYGVTISDANDCTVELSTVLTDPAPVEIAFQSENVLCFGGNDGSIDLEISGAVGTPNFTWDNNLPNTSTPNLLTADLYCVTVSDDNNCVAETCIPIQEPTELSATLQPDRVDCDETDNGAIETSVLGGTFPYSFNWSNGSTEQDLSNLTIGNYTLTLTDANACEVIVATEVEQSAPAFQLAFSTLPVTCFGENSGAIELEINGANSALTFAWNGPNGFQNNNQDLENVAAGTYQVLVEDADGCEVEGEVVLNQPAAITADLDITDASCYNILDGGVIVQADGGVSPFMYSFDNGDSFNTSPLFFGVPDGNYSVLIQDANGCELLENFTINEPDEITIDLDQNIEIDLGESYVYEVTTNLLDSEIDTIIWTTIDSLNCTNCLTIEATPETTTGYTIQIIDQNGCEGQAFTLLFVNIDIGVYVPNIFSPNGDEINDLVSVFAKEVNIKRIVNFHIFDRWGELVYQDENFQPNEEMRGWDGTLAGEPMNPATFVWFLEVELLDGTMKLLQGDVSLVR